MALAAHSEHAGPLTNECIKNPYVAYTFYFFNTFQNYCLTMLPICANMDSALLCGVMLIYRL